MPRGALIVRIFHRPKKRFPRSRRVNAHFERTGFQYNRIGSISDLRDKTLVRENRNLRPRFTEAAEVLEPNFHHLGHGRTEADFEQRALQGISPMMDPARRRMHRHGTAVDDDVVHFGGVIGVDTGLKQPVAVSEFHGERAKALRGRLWFTAKSSFFQQNFARSGVSGSFKTKIHLTL